MDDLTGKWGRVDSLARNPHLFLGLPPQYVKGQELRANRIRNAELLLRVQEIQSQCVQALHSCAEGEEALKRVGEQERRIIQAECQRRWEELFQLLHTLIKAKKESVELAKTVLAQETYWYCSHLLDYLHKQRYKLAPLNLANALAGLPDMGWRESFVRCSRMPRCSPEMLPYQMFKVVARICGRGRKGVEGSPTEFFHDQILKLPRKYGGIRETLRRVWRDLCLAIVECWAQHNQDFMPYAITLAFLRKHRRPKTEAERMLDQHEAQRFALQHSSVSKKRTKSVK